MCLGLEEVNTAVGERGKRTIPVTYAGRATAGRGQGREGSPLNRRVAVIFDVGLRAQPLTPMGQASLNGR